jgi:anti-anti-sigma factor
MHVKIDTKQKFHVITIQEPVLYANMTEILIQELMHYLQKDVKNIVLRCTEITQMEIPAAEAILTVQQKAYEKNASFVICELKPEVEDFLEAEGILELMNVTPTESEAWDIVQMEEIEREMFGDEAP